jgi:23S rRNA (adenine-N6)-dimethyltransferase
VAQNTYRIRNERARARRAYSQTFLTDRGALGQVVRAARPADTDLVLEIGAGAGHLTRELARVASRVVAYEVDPDLAAGLDPPSNVVIRQRDFLAARPPREPFAVVGNIPYALTARVVEWCLRAPSLTSATLVTQLEYARKRTGDYGRWSRLTIETWPTHRWVLAGRIGRHKFRPVPRVDSGILRLERRPVPLVEPRLLESYRRFVELGFSGVGGSLHASLRQRHPARRVDAAFRACRLDPGLVVAYAWPEQWLTLFRALTAP